MFLIIKRVEGNDKGGGTILFARYKISRDFNVWSQVYIKTFEEDYDKGLGAIFSPALTLSAALLYAAYVVPQI